MTPTTPPAGYRYFTLHLPQEDGSIAPEHFLLTEAQHATATYVVDNGLLQVAECEKRLETCDKQLKAAASAWTQRTILGDIGALERHKNGVTGAIIEMLSDLSEANKALLSPDKTPEETAAATAVFNTYEGLEKLADPFRLLLMPAAFR